MRKTDEWRKVTFRGAGENDISEVTINTGDFAVRPGNISREITYTISYAQARSHVGQDPELAEAVSDAVRARLRGMEDKEC